MRYLFFLFAVWANAQTVPPEPQGASPATPDSASNLKPEERCRIEGKAVNALTGEPLNKVEVWLYKQSDKHDGSILSYSEPDGQFVLDDLEPGQYTLGATRNGYTQLTYGSKDRSGSGTVLTLSKGQALTGIALQMQPQGVITGKVIDEDGEPIPVAQVQILRYVYRNGHKELLPARQFSANDLGEYRAFGLPPGRYYASVSYLPSSSQRRKAARVVGPARARALATQGYSNTFYPNSLSPESASAIDVRAGAQVQGIDIKLIPARLFAISGRVAGLTPGLKDLPLMLIARNDTLPNRPGHTNIDDKGAFQFRGISPGSYVISADASDNGKTLDARVPVEVTDSNVDGVQVSFAPLPSINGQLMVENNADSKDADIHIFIAAVGPLSMMNSAVEAQVNSDRKFTLGGVAPENYQVLVNGLPKNFFVKSVRFGDMDITESNLDFSRGAVAGDLAIVVSAAAAEVEGTVQNGSQQPQAGATVVLIPSVEKRKLPQLYRTASTDQNGHFLLQGIRPGDYKLFAWDRVESGAYEDPDFLAIYETRGEAISVKENSHENVQLTSIPADEANRN